MIKKQQMRWNRWTMQPFLDVRVAVLNGTLVLPAIPSSERYGSNRQRSLSSPQAGSPRFCMLSLGPAPQPAPTRASRACTSTPARSRHCSTAPRTWRILRRSMAWKSRCRLSMGCSTCSRSLLAVLRGGRGTAPHRQVVQGRLSASRKRRPVRTEPALHDSMELGSGRCTRWRVSAQAHT